MINIDLSAKKPVYHLFELNGKKYILDYRIYFIPSWMIFCSLFFDMYKMEI